MYVIIEKIILYYTWIIYIKIIILYYLKKVHLNNSYYRIIKYLQLTTNIRKVIIERLENLEKSLSRYFPATYNDIDWIQNPFVNQKKPDMLSLLKYEHLIEIKSMSSLKQKFEFWIEFQSSY